jgi:DNA-binding MarR family transcriptional regulator
MLNNYELQKTWHKLTMTRELNERIKLNKGIRLTDNNFAILCLIAHHPAITIQGINKHPYFRDLSLSTVKRHIRTLLDEELVIATIGDNDKRERVLTIRVK